MKRRVFHKIEHIVGKGDYASNKYFFPLQQYFNTAL